MANVFTFTTTKNRLELVKIQTSSLISKLVPTVTEKQIDKIDRIIEDKVIKVLSIYGFDSEDCCHLQLNLEFDWDEHYLEITSGNKEIGLDDSWKNNICPEVRDFARSFKNMASKLPITKTEYRVSFCDGVDYTKYGFKDGTTIKWNRKTEFFQEKIEGLSELELKLYVAD
ncbi:MAG: hypothetical protein ACK4ZH_01030 [Dolichospermum sp.]|jgi:hypothetical protein|nr:hypothetical protein [Dolichospermum circinale Clear-D4]OBQ34916.1 MAG: hypothetical protein AN487_16915 [Anabaena sp. CRKS33]